jgi:tape measure domain-containing protein
MDQNVLQLILRVRDEASQELQKFSGTLDKMGDNFEKNLGKAGAMSAGILTALGLMTKAALTNAASYEQNRVSLETMLGSADRAKDLLRELSDFASKTPFELPTVVEGSKQLLGYGIAANKVMPILDMLGDVAATVGADKFPTLITALGQVQAKGELSSRQLLQFTNSGVGLGAELQKMFGVTQETMNNMIGDGKIGFTEVTKALQNMTSQGGMYFQGMENQAKSLNGIIANISDSVGRSIRQLVGIDSQGDIREGSLFAVVKDAAEKFLVVLEKVTPVVTDFITKMMQHKEVVMAIAGALGGLLVLALIALISAIGGALIVMAEFVIVGAAIGLAVGFIIAHFNEWKAKAIEVIDYIKTIPAAIGEFVKGIINWFIQLPGSIKQFFLDLFLIDIPFAVGYVAGYLSKAIPDMIAGVGAWFESLPARISQGLISFGNAVKDKVLSIGSFIQEQFSQMPDRINAFISRIPSVMADVFERAKQAVLDKITGIWKGVTGTLKKIGDMLSGIVSGGGNIVEKIVNAAKAGFTAGQDAYAEGGYVRRTGSALVHQGEFVLSRDMLTGQSAIPASVAETFNQPINIQAVMNSEMDLNLLGYRLAWALRNAR